MWASRQQALTVGRPKDHQLTVKGKKRTKRTLRVKRHCPVRPVQGSAPAARCAAPTGPGNEGSTGQKYRPAGQPKTRPKSGRRPLVFWAFCFRFYFRPPRGVILADLLEHMKGRLDAYRRTPAEDGVAREAGLAGLMASLNQIAATTHEAAEAVKAKMGPSRFAHLEV
jgi:hypothetical protein